MITTVSEAYDIENMTDIIRDKYLHVMLHF